MTEFKGTPGPWQVGGPCCDAVVTDFDGSWYKVVCRRLEGTGGKLTDEYNANMHIIAAAPELLEALQQVLPHLREQAKQDGHAFGTLQFVNRVIAKALGQTS